MTGVEVETKLDSLLKQIETDSTGKDIRQHLVEILQLNNSVMSEISTGYEPIPASKIYEICKVE